MTQPWTFLWSSEESYQISSVFPNSTFANTSEFNEDRICGVFWPEPKTATSPGRSGKV